MSWMQMLCDTYEFCESEIGKKVAGTAVPLLPIAHMTQNAHIELWLDLQGNLLPSPGVITSKEDNVTIIPCTEASESRSGTNPVHHPLFDKLQYLAGDYTAYGGEKSAEFHARYLKDLAAWCASPESHPRVCAVLRYLQKGTLMADLLRLGILPADEQGQPLLEWRSELGKKQGIFAAASSPPHPLDAFVRLDVHTGDPETPPLWKDPSVWNSHIRFYAAQQGKPDLCYVCGKVMLCADMSPKKIRHAADQAKLISSNDSTGFTYRGRFLDAEQALRIGYETTQKAHNVLRWLIARQGYRNGDQVYVAWGIRNERLPSLAVDTLDLFAEFDPELTPPNVETEAALRLNLLMQGYHKELGEHAQMVVLGLDSATSGRLSIFYYRELSGSDLLERIERWHRTCRWRLCYRKNPRGGKKAPLLSYIGAPSPKDIARAAYGSGANDKLVRATIQRILSCIVDGAPFPLDVMRSVVQRASNPLTMEDGEYQKTVSIACAVIRKYHIDQTHHEEEWTMSKSHYEKDRSYQFGQLLACYEDLERCALQLHREDRRTNAERFHCEYTRQPAKILALLHQKCLPYIERFPDRAIEKRQRIIDLTNQLQNNASPDFSNQPLSELYLLGYDSMLAELREK